MTSTGTTVRAGLAVLVVAAAALGLVRLADPADAVVALDPGTGLVGAQDTRAARWLRDNPGDPRAAAVARELLAHPVSEWITGPESETNIRDMVDVARDTGGTALFTVYDHPGLDDGLGNDLDAPGSDLYRQQVAAMVGLVGDTRALVVLEPDALWFADRLGSDAARDARLEDLRAAVDLFARGAPNTAVYLDAGTTSGSVTPERMAELLLAAGVQDARGFAVGVSSYAPDDDAQAYGERIVRELEDLGVPGARFVVDTSRNGNPEWSAPYEWCNPADRELGRAPELYPATGAGAGSPSQDASLWVKEPGSSDGSCGAAPGSEGGSFVPALAGQLLADL